MLRFFFVFIEQSCSPHRMQSKILAANLCSSSKCSILNMLHSDNKQKELLKASEAI